MGILDSILGRRSGGGKGATVPAGHVQETYQRLIRAQEQPPGTILVQMGDIYRDLGDRPRAARFYEEAAEQFVREERWSMASAAAQRARHFYGRSSGRLLAVALDVALGRRSAAEVIQALDALAREVAPSEDALIERLSRAIDDHALPEAKVEIAFAELLATLGRPEAARSRLLVAAGYARQKGERTLLLEIDSRLGPAPEATPPEDVPVRKTPPVAREADAHAAPPAPEDRPAKRSERPAAPGERVRIDATDPECFGRSDDEAVRELLGQLRAGLDQHIDPLDAAQHFELGYAFLSMRLYAEAADAFRRAGQSPLHRERATEGLAEALVEAGEWAEADALFQGAGIANESAPAGLLYWYARLAEERGERAEAARRYSRISTDFRDARARRIRLG